MAGSNSKSIVIKGKLQFDASSATKALESLSQKFKSFEKSSFTKMMLSDFTKLAPVIKSLDKGLSTMMQTLSKNEAKSRMKELTQGLKDQAAQLKEIVKQQETYNNLMKQVPDGSAPQQRYREERDALANKGRSVMGKMEEFSDEKKALNKTDPEQIKKIVAAVAVSMNMAGGAANYVLQKELRKTQNQGEGASVNNRLSSMMFDKDSSAFGFLARANGLGDMNSESKDAQKGGWFKKGGAAAADIVSGIGVGGLVAGPIGAAFEGVSKAGGHLFGNADLMGLSGDASRQANIQADLAGNKHSSINSRLSKDAFNIELGDMLLSQAEMKRDTMAATVGSSGNNGSKAMYRNFGVGARVGGMGMAESAGAMGALGRVAIGDNERSGPDAMRMMMEAKQSGTASVGDFTGMVSGLSNVSGNNTKNVATVYQMLEKAVKTGVDKSQVSNLVRATEEVAGYQKVALTDTSTVMNDMLQMLSYKKPGEVGAGDIRGAKSAAEMIQGQTHTSRGLDVGMQSTSAWVEKMGGKTPDIATWGLLSHFKSRKDILNSAEGRNMAERSGVLKQLQASEKAGEDDLVGASHTADSFRANSFSPEAAEFSLPENILRLRTLNKQMKYNKKGNLKWTGSAKDRAERDAMQGRAETANLQQQFQGDWDEQTAAANLAQMSGMPVRSGGKGMAATMGGKDLTGHKAGVELAKLSKAGEESFVNMFGEALTAHRAAINQGLSATLPKSGDFTQLTESLERLISAIYMKEHMIDPGRQQKADNTRAEHNREWKNRGSNDAKAGFDAWLLGNK